MVLIPVEWLPGTTAGRNSDLELMASVTGLVFWVWLTS